LVKPFDFSDFKTSFSVRDHFLPLTALDIPVATSAGQAGVVSEVGGSRS
jgi:hypothetical protein